MKSLSFKLTLIISLLGLFGCTPVITSSEPLSISINQTPEEIKRDVYDTTYTYPSSIKLDYKIPMVMDEWTSEDKTPVVGHKVGSQFDFVIHNGEDTPVKFKASVVIPNSQEVVGNWSEENKKYYKVAPVELLRYIKLGMNEVILSPDSIVRIPIIIDIPEKISETVTLEGDMEFRILVENNNIEQIGGQGLTTATEIRMFMEPK